MKKILFVTMLVFSGLSINAQWIEVNNGLDLLLGSTPTYPHISVLATTGTNIFAGTDTAGVFLSTNNGNSWIAVNNGLSNHHVTSLAVSGTKIFAGTWGGVFLSTNNGGSWVSVNNALTSRGIQALAITGTNIYAGGHGVFLSTNNGGSWTQVINGLIGVNPGGYPDTIGIWTLAVSGTNIYAGTYANAYNNGIFLSTNNGGNWTSVSTGMSWALAASGTDVFSVGLQNNRVYRSSDNGNIWTYTTIGYANTEAHSIAISGTKIFAGGSSGVYLSTDNGNTWSTVNTGLPTNPWVYPLATSGTIIYAGTDSKGVWKRPLSEMVGIEEESNNEDTFILYPNPTDGKFTIGGNDIRSIEISNILGKKIYKSEIQNSKSEIDLLNQPKGIYFVQIIDKNKNVTNKKIVIQ